MINEVYNSRILELAGNIPWLGRLGAPDATATAHSKLCGSTVIVDLKMDGDEVTDFAHDAQARAPGQASSSIMARNVIGARAPELRAVRESVRRMRKENGAPPEGKWADIAVPSSRCATTTPAMPRRCSRSTPWSTPSARSRRFSRRRAAQAAQ
jgi:NifU-like protein involved in Fe-S cluster formation